MSAQSGVESNFMSYQFEHDGIRYKRKFKYLLYTHIVEEIARSIMRWRVRINSTIAPWCTNHFSIREGTNKEDLKRTLLQQQVQSRRPYIIRLPIQTR